MSGLGGLEAGPHESRAVLHVNPENRAHRAQFKLDLQGRGRGRLSGGCAARADGQASITGGLGAGARERGAVWCMNPKPSPCGAQFQLDRRGGSGGSRGVVERTSAKRAGWGVGAVRVRGGQFGAQPENRALWARFRLDLQGRGEGGVRGVVWCQGWPSEQAGGAGGRCA